MGNKKYNRVHLDRDKFQGALDELGYSVTKIASLINVASNTIHYRMIHGWRKFDAEIVARFLKIKLADLI